MNCKKKEGSPKIELSTGNSMKRRQRTLKTGRSKPGERKIYRILKGGDRGFREKREGRQFQNKRTVKKGNGISKEKGMGSRNPLRKEEIETDWCLKYGKSKRREKWSLSRKGAKRWSCLW